MLSTRLSSDLGADELALFDVYLSILDDNMLGVEVKNRIREGNLAQGALRHVIMQYVNQFRLMEDVYLRERATDILDLGVRLLAHLQGNEPQWQNEDFPENTILISEELTPGMLAMVPTKKLRGLVSVRGSSNSHVAILARSMGVPAVMGVVDVPYNQLHSLGVIVDGYRGLIYSNPSKILRKQYRAIFKEEKALRRDLRGLRELPAATRDGYRIPLCVNTGLMTDAVRSLRRGAEGVGLYRTEVPFMMKERFPSETEQQEVYRQQLDAFAPNPVTMRTLDVGGDKPLSYFPITEENPFLGWRGIRVTLDHPEIFLVQLRAMLKASEGLNNLRIMLPMVSSTSEVDDALHLLYRAHAEVLEEGFDVVMPKVGVMIEVPAMVYQISDLCKQVDFLSVGSNDLTQYLLAVDRNNPRVANVYSHFHPSVLRALTRLVKECHKYDKPVSICGEMAGDPLSAVLLMAMGFNTLSMSSSNILRVRKAICHVPMSEAQEQLERVLKMNNSLMVKSWMEYYFKTHGLGDMVKASTRIVGA